MFLYRFAPSTAMVDEGLPGERTLISGGWRIVSNDPVEMEVSVVLALVVFGTFFIILLL